MSSGTYSDNEMSASAGMEQQQALSALWDGELRGEELERLLSAMAVNPALGQRWSRLCATHAALEGVQLHRRLCLAALTSASAPASGIQAGAQEGDFASGVMAALAHEPPPARWKEEMPSDHAMHEFIGQTVEAANDHPAASGAHALRAAAPSVALQPSSRVAMVKRYRRPALGWLAAAAATTAVVIMAPRTTVQGPEAVPATGQQTLAQAAPPSPSAWTGDGAEQAATRMTAPAASSGAAQTPITVAAVNKPATAMRVAAATPAAGSNWPGVGRNDAVFFSVGPSGELVPIAVKEATLAQVDPETARMLDDYVIEHSNYRMAAGFGGSLGYARFAAHTAELRATGGGGH